MTTKNNLVRKLNFFTKYKKGIYLFSGFPLIILGGLAPFLPVILASFIARLFGLELSDLNFSSSQLHTLEILCWFIFFTIPIAGIALIGYSIFVIWYIISKRVKKKAIKKEDGYYSPWETD
jgi:TRAP-type C4-dicarboxylate transport system permease small subunit